MDTLVRKMTRQAYDLQELRIATGLRVVSQFRSRFGEDAVETEDAEAEEKKKDKLLKEISAAYERVTDGVAENTRKKAYKFDSIIRDEPDLWFVENYFGILAQEKECFKRLEKVLNRDSFYIGFLSKIKGIGPAMAGVIISEFDPYKAKYPSSFWKYAGLDVVEWLNPETKEVEHQGRRNFKHHLVQSTYLDKNGAEQVKMGISYNPWLKSKLLAVVATSFLRANNDKYVPIYKGYKERQMNNPKLADKPGIKAIAHKRAIRYMIKMFLIDLHMAWREHEGLVVSLPYAEAKLGYTHGRDPSAEARVGT